MVLKLMDREEATDALSNLGTMFGASKKKRRMKSNKW